VAPPELKDFAHEEAVLVSHVLLERRLDVGRLVSATLGRVPVAGGVDHVVEGDVLRDDELHVRRSVQLRGELSSISSSPNSRDAGESRPSRYLPAP
jgi:hypothetical protein